MLQFWSAYVPCSSQHLDSVQLALEQIDLIRRLVNKHSDSMVLVTTAEGVYTLSSAHSASGNIKNSIRHWLETLNAPWLARMNLRPAIHLAHGQFDLTSTPLDTPNTFDWKLARPALRAIQKNMWTTVSAEGTSESHRFKMLAIFHSNGKIYPPRITTNIPLNPLMPAILLDNPEFRPEINVLPGAGSILHNCSLYQSTPLQTRLMFKVTETKSTVLRPSSVQTDF